MHRTIVYFEVYVTVARVSISANENLSLGTAMLFPISIWPMKRTEKQLFAQLFPRCLTSIWHSNAGEIHRNRISKFSTVFRFAWWRVTRCYIIRKLKILKWVELLNNTTFVKVIYNIFYTCKCYIVQCTWHFVQYQLQTTCKISDIERKGPAMQSRSGAAFLTAITFACEAVIACTRQLDIIDEECGEGNYGTALARGANAIKTEIKVVTTTKEI